MTSAFTPSGSLDRLLKPDSIALVGASSNNSALGGRALDHLSRWQGRLYLVNPRQAHIGERPCFASIEQLPEAVDCAVLAIPADQVEAAVRQCASLGIGAVVVFASGYAETGDDEGRAAQARLASLAAAGGMRLVGPNCVGVASHRHALNAAFAGFPPLAGPGDGLDGQGAAPRIALVSQSGALALALSQAAERGVPLSHVLTCGNSSDVDVADYLVWLAAQPECRGIALTYEGLRDPDRLAPAIGEALDRGKKLAICRLGLSPPGQDAIRRHTATMSRSSPALAAAMSRQGVLSLTAIERLIETACFLAKAPDPAPQARGVAVLSASGGTGILAVDAAFRAGVTTPQPQRSTRDRLQQCLPGFASARNPCDTTAQSTRHPTLLLDAAQALLADPGYAALVLPWGRSQSANLFPELARLSRQHGKPVCVVWMSPSPGQDLLRPVEGDPTLALFLSLDACFESLAGWLRG